MQEYSDEYDCFVDSIKKDWYEGHKNSLFDYLAFLHWNGNTLLTFITK